MPRNKLQGETWRIHLLVSEKMKGQLDQAQKLSGATSITEVLRRATNLYLKMLEAQENGMEIFCKLPDGKEVNILTI